MSVPIGAIIARQFRRTFNRSVDGRNVEAQWFVSCLDDAVFKMRRVETPHVRQLWSQACLQSPVMADGYWCGSVDLHMPARSRGPAAPRGNRVQSSPIPTNAAFNATLMKIARLPWRRRAGKDVDMRFPEPHSRHFDELGKRKRRAKGHLDGGVDRIVEAMRPVITEAIEDTDSPLFTEVEARRIEMHDMRIDMDDVEGGRVNKRCGRSERDAVCRDPRRQGWRSAEVAPGRTERASRMREYLPSSGMGGN